MMENNNLVQFIFNQNREVIAEKETTWTSYIRGSTLLASSADHARTYYHYASDEMSSVTHIVDDEKVLNEYEYDAWGEVVKSTETVKNRFKFNGQQLDPITQQYYLRARFYNPVIARFTQEDTYRGDGLNLYAYCGNNPTYYVDPTGHECQSKSAPYPISDLEKQARELAADVYVANKKNGTPTSYGGLQYNPQSNNTAQNQPKKPKAEVLPEPINKDTQQFPDIYQGVKAASEYLKAQGLPRELRKRTLESFNVETIHLGIADNNTYGLRFYDTVGAKAKGRYLFETFNPLTNRQNLALPPVWNRMTGIQQFQVRPNTLIVKGQAAPQFQLGSQYVGGETQWYINNLDNLIH